jgi:hypothetical protein
MMVRQEDMYLKQIQQLQNRERTEVEEVISTVKGILVNSIV